MIYNPLGIHYCMIDNTDIDLLDPSPYRAPWAPNRRQRQPSPAQTNASLRPAPRTLALGGVGKTHVIHMEYVYIYIDTCDIGMILILIVIVTVVMQLTNYKDYKILT